MARELNKNPNEQGGEPPNRIALPHARAIEDRGRGIVFCPRCGYVVVGHAVKALCPQCGYRFFASCSDWQN